MVIAYTILEASWIPLTNNSKVGSEHLEVRYLLDALWLLGGGLSAQVTQLHFASSTIVSFFPFK